MNKKIRYSETQETAANKYNWHDIADNYGCFMGIYFDVEDGIPGLTDVGFNESEWTVQELNDEWLPALFKFIKETA